MPAGELNNKNHPIIFIHAGTAYYDSNPEHLEYVLRQAKETNPDSTIYLIGDDKNNKYDFIEHCDIKNYFKDSDVQNFKKIYKHFSRSPYESDLFVFQRWLILRNFVIEKKIDKFLLVDTDIMIFCDIKKEFDKFKDYDFTISFEQSPHCIFFNNQESLIDFCKFFMDIYAGKNDEDYFRIKKHYTDLKISNKLGGNVCDMTFFKLFKSKGYRKIFDTTEIINGSTYDNNINCSFDNKYGYKMRFWAKKIFWINKLPYCELIESNKKIKFNALHFQGSNKKYIKKIYYHKQAVSISEVIINFYKRIKNKIKKIMPNFLWDAIKKIAYFFIRLKNLVIARHNAFKKRGLHKTRLRQNKIRRANLIPEKNLKITKKVFLDCGTHEGEGLQYFINLYDMNDSWTIYTFEPNKIHYQLLENKFKQKNIKIFHNAVWISDGFIDFFPSWDNSGSSIFADAAELAGATLRKRLIGGLKGPITEKNEEYIIYKEKKPLPANKVKCIDLSSFLKNNFDRNDYIIIKLDIEGAEYEVLRKMKKDGTLSYVDEIYIEFHDRFMENENDKTTQQIIEGVKKLGVKFNQWD